MSKVKKEMTVTAWELREEDEIYSHGFVHLINPIPNSASRQIVIEYSNGLLKIVAMDNDEELLIVRKVEKPESATVQINNGDTLEIFDLNDSNRVAIALYNGDRSFYGCPSLNANELIDAIKTVKGLD